MSDFIYDSDDSSYSDISICEELTTLVLQCESIHLHHDTIIERLGSLHSKITKQPSIVLYNEEGECTLESILEMVHAETLKEIGQGKDVSFGRRLMETLEKYSMK